MQIILQKSKVYLIFYVFLLKILSIFTVKTSKWATHYLEPPALSLCTWYFVPLYFTWFLKNQYPYRVPQTRSVIMAVI